MITSSFCCFKGLSRSAEQMIWERGCLSWDRVKFLPEKTFSLKKTRLLFQEIRQAQKALDADLVDYFLCRFNGADKVRVFKEFRSTAVILDIETTGLSSTDIVTSIAAIKKGRIYVFIDGFDLDDFLFLLKNVNLIVTFNGTRFDLPFLKRHFKFDLNIPHLDMMPVLGDLGYRGGQKKCEQLFGLKRTKSFGMLGENAVRLWRSWKDKNDLNALRQLAYYNAEDVFMLERLIVKAYNQVIRPMPVRTVLDSSFDHIAIQPDMISCNVL